MAAPTPQWSVTTGLTDSQTGRCLDSNAAGNVYTNPCQAPGNTYQDWVETFWGDSSGQGFFSFRNVATGRCLDSSAAGDLYTLPCQAPGNTYQDWDFSGSRFLDRATQRCLDSNQAGNAYTLPCNGGGFQNWKPTANQWSIKTGLIDLQTGRCLDSNAAGNVYTNPCQAPGNTFQDWVESFWGGPSGPGGLFSFRDVATGRCLDSNAAGNLYTLPCQAPGNTYQDWDFSGSRFLDHATQRCLDSNQAGNAYTLPCNGGAFQAWNPAGNPSPAPQPTPSSGLPRYVALGDSFSSGQGASGTAETAYWGSVRKAPCRRSPNAYPMLLARMLQGRYQFDPTSDFLACAGAQVELPKSDSGPTLIRDQVPHLAPNVGLITVSIGGDDVGWTAVLTQCVKQNAAALAGPPLVGAVVLALGCKNIFDQALNHAESLLNTRLPDAYKAIRRAAPHATVIVVGYPLLVADDLYPHSMTCPDTTLLNLPARVNFDNDTAQVDNLIQSIATRRQFGFKFVDPRAAFANHGICGRAGQDWIGGFPADVLQWIHPPITSFHPNQLGQAAYANAIASAHPAIFG